MATATTEHNEDMANMMPDERELTKEHEWIVALEQALTELRVETRTEVGTGAQATSGGHEEQAADLAARWANSFPAASRTPSGAIDAARDIERIRHLSTDDAACPLHRDARLYRDEKEPADQLRLKVYQLGGSMLLSDAVPALENFGFVVLAEIPTELGANSEAQSGTIHDFRLRVAAGEDASALLARAATIEAAISGVINDRAENDLFNRLVTYTGLDAESANWLRAIYRFLRQTNSTFSIRPIADALYNAPEITAALVRLFQVQHDPRFGNDRENTAENVRGTIREQLAAVSSIEDDRLLRLYWSTIDAIVRTNAFAEAGRDALAFKIDSSLVPGLPKPVPWREIFVYSRDVEGTHLRAGPVARGGLRWSDRPDDFRTETLGLLKAQRVKNAVIVPTGAKGGFYPKRLPDAATDRDAWLAEGRERYKLFIRTLLSITDNIVEDEVIHPDEVVIHDGDDPYFVVAADKGTATFSDTANAIAEDRGFWLGDAFASGGSNGYDHKKMAITARGAWVSVQRHFLEMGIDVQNDPIQVVGCGDMSGDVFGNGMLLSKAIKLVAAFDHRHIFIDPNPDPKTSWDERKRLFDLPRSSWADYSEELLSKGGGIYPRTLKHITLSPEAQEALGITESELDPSAIVNAILKSPVDLIWFGGIGTYLKASTENHTDARDPANDPLRANASEVRAKVIGEGANLGVTQAARIEYALNGGRINADFIDNSAGVDCSDNEVNIKIALASACRTGELSQEHRNTLLEEMTDEVAALVLEDNRLQTMGLSIAELGGATAVAPQLQLLETLEDIGGLDRLTEGLAENDVYMRRAADGQGLARPELAVLLSNAKLVLQAAIENGDVAQDPAAEPLLLSTFPKRMQQEFREHILQHPLRAELVATAIANKIVNRMGVLHPFELVEEEGASLAQLAPVFIAACQFLDMDKTWADIETREMPETARLALFDRAALALRGHMADLLRAGGAALPPSQLNEELASEVEKLIDRLDETLPETARYHAQMVAQELAESGAPDDLAAQVARLFVVDGAIGLARLSRDTGIAANVLADGFIELGEELGLDWAHSRAALKNPSDPWERLFVAGLACDFQQMRIDFLRRQADSGNVGTDSPVSVKGWVAEHSQALQRFSAMVARIQRTLPLTPAMLAQIAGQARNLLQR